MGERKNLTILLIFLLLLIIGGGLYFFKVLQPAKTTEDLTTNSTYKEVFAVKKKAIANILDFLPTKNIALPLFDKFYSSQQYQALEETKVQIDLQSGIGNPEPFTPPLSRE